MCHCQFDNHCRHLDFPRNPRSQRGSGRMGALLSHFPRCLHFAWIERKEKKVFPKQFKCHLQPYAWFNSHRSVSVGDSDWPKLFVPLFALDYFGLLAHHRSCVQNMFTSLSSMDVPTF